MKKLLLILVISTGLITLICSGVAEQKKEILPNIVFILADDMGYGDLGCYNKNSKIPTPNIDKLANEGILFTDAHSSGSWCVPSRYGLITGRYPGRRTDLNTSMHSLIEPQQETLATLLKRNGYRTACVGKWHLGFDEVDWKNPQNISKMKGGPTEKGFDYFFGMHASLDIPPYFYIENDHAVSSPSQNIGAHASPDATSAVSGAFFREGAISPDFRHENVLDVFLEKAKHFMGNPKENNQDKPFFLYLALTAPHTPWLPKDKFVGESRAGEYGDFTMQIDDLTGQLMTYLKNNNLIENTIIFFSSDNGPVWFDEDITKYDHQSTGGLRGMKGDAWEGGSRIPFIVSSPTHFKATGLTSNHLIGFTDVMATLSDLVGDTSKDNADLNSYSFLPILTNSQFEKPMRKDLVLEKSYYRDGDWKYIKGSGQGGIAKAYAPNKENIIFERIPGALYNLKEDLSEQNNLYEVYPEKVKSMEQTLSEILKTK